jgi:hypothetical protein
LLFPLRVNELLDRPLIVSFNVAFGFQAASFKPELPCFNEACLTLELTGRADAANRFKFSIKATLLALRLNELLCAVSNASLIPHLLIYSRL